MSFVGKLREKMVLARLDQFLKQSGLYPSIMSGFSRGSSAVDNRIDLGTSIHERTGLHCFSAALLLHIRTALEPALPQSTINALHALRFGDRLFCSPDSYPKDRNVSNAIAVIALKMPGKYTCVSE